jgi:hypothetical protein
MRGGHPEMHWKERGLDRQARQDQRQRDAALPAAGQDRDRTQVDAPGHRIGQRDAQQHQKAARNTRTEIVEGRADRRPTARKRGQRDCGQPEDLEGDIKIE